MSPLDIAVVVAYVAVLLVLSAYGSHRYYMAYLYYRHKFRLPTPKRRFTDLASPSSPSPLQGEVGGLPRITVQLPIFNEMYVVNRLIGAVCALDYPRELLEIQVLDDSIDETSEIASACVDRWREQGLDVIYVRRTSRLGFKAGALENGLALAKGEFIAVFDVAGSTSTATTARSRRRRASCSTLISSSSTPRATARERSSTSTARLASGAARRSRAPAGGSTTRSRRTSTSRTARSSRAGASCFCPRSPPRPRSLSR